MKKLIGIAGSTAPHQIAAASALKEGVERHGHPVAIIDNLRYIPREVTAVACWGWRQGAPIRERGRNVLVMERGYIGDRFAWTSLGWNGLNGRAYAPTPENDGSRFRRHFGELLRPWNPSGSYALLIGQVQGDAALRGGSIDHFYARVAREAKTHWHAPVRFRPHPVAITRGYNETVPGAETLGGDLAAAIEGARVVITWNSNTAVESVLAGKPTIAMDAGSMAWSVTEHELVDAPEEPKRLPWAEALAWRQWTLDEIRSGYAWDVVGGGDLP